MKYPFLFFLVYVFVSVLAMQPANAQKFKLMRYDEDYTYLKNDTSPGWYNHIKFIPFTADKKIYASIGGEARYEMVYTHNADWNEFGEGDNHYLLQRYDLHADVHLGNRVRLFTQLRSALESGSKDAPRPIDEDKMNIQNLFADVIAWQQGRQQLTVRLGRQELDYGTGRLISVREGPNVRQYFTGGKIMYTTPSLAVDGFVMMDDKVNTGFFDNKPTHQANLWGVYSHLVIPASGNIDFTYLGIRRDNAVFEEGEGKEVRHTIAARYWKYGGGFIYNVEGAYQFGSFNKGNINAWTAAIDIGYRFDHVKFTPSVNLRNDYISGDKRPGDGSLQTFNPLYPKGGYFGFNPRIGPANLIDLHPYVTAAFTGKLTMQADVVINWRYSLMDGIYRPSGTFNLAGEGSDKRYIGTAYLLNASYAFSKYMVFTCGGQFFKTGAFIHDKIQPAVNSSFVNAQLAFKF
ncbi:alginate export family protein [Deminuibacter soli]|uniref:Alginate export domain-containing protein n=1 Tax=Deminuibacter soli TaxID=2291815 RepID=A0A3E1NPF7_9BACT|nr:alginate export family protein [Deminuibacter soli]RFM29668.1 hypothetical protein DXN05_01415 [Deminuibacter soli]